MKLRFSACAAALLVAAAVLWWMSTPAQAQRNAIATPGRDAAFKEAAAKPTPRSADGHPDLTGFWTNGLVPRTGGVFSASGHVSDDGKVLDLGLENERDLCILAKNTFKNRTASRSFRPPYKPQYLATVEDNFNRKQFADPAFRCQPEGIPRSGAPQEIVQTPAAIYLFYRPLENNNSFRFIPMDGRPHNKDADAMADGDSVGRWEGDTLVVDVTNLSEDTWLDRDGDIHSANLHVIERFARQGNTLRYEATVEDPVMLTKPWSPMPQTVMLGKPGEHIEQNYPCSERSTPHLVNNDRH